MRTLQTWTLASLLIFSLNGQPPTTAAPATTTDPPALEQLSTRIVALKAKNSRWREIQWNRCLLDGMAKSRAKNRPIVFWVFLHNPNEERC